MSLLADAIEAFAKGLLKLPDDTLRHPWPGGQGEDGWQAYSDNLSDVSFLVYQKLRAFSVTVHSTRATRGPIVTEAQRILAQHQLAYRDFHGVMAGVRDEDLDATPSDRKWSLRTNLVHLVLAECWSQGPQVRHALKQRRAGKEPGPMPIRDEVTEREAPMDYGSLADLLARFDARHDDLVCSLTDITDHELDTPSLYWEDQPVDVRFRLCRLAWHIRSHTMQADKIRIGLGHQLCDMDRLARLLYSALGDAEGALIGAGETFEELQNSVATAIHIRAREIAALRTSSSRPAVM